MGCWRCSLCCAEVPRTPTNVAPCPAARRRFTYQKRPRAAMSKHVHTNQSNQDQPIQGTESVKSQYHEELRVCQVSRLESILKFPRREEFNTDPVGSGLCLAAPLALISSAGIRFLPDSHDTGLH